MLAVKTLSSWEWGMLEHASAHPESTHPDGIRVARRALASLQSVGAEDKQLVASCEALEELLRRASK